MDDTDWPDSGNASGGWQAPGTSPSDPPTPTGPLPPPPPVGGEPAFQPTGMPPTSARGGWKMGLGIVAGILVLLVVAGVFVFRFIRDNIEFEDGFMYGDNPSLDVLWDNCAAGTMQACDDLYLRSNFDSEYERFGDTCGNRNEPQGWCVDVHGDFSPQTGRR